MAKEYLDKTGLAYFWGKLKVYFGDLLDDKQDKLTSGTNIKTINNNSVLGSGDISIESTKVVALTQAEYDALSTAEKNDGTVYCVTDAQGTYMTAGEVSYGSSNVQDALDDVKGDIPQNVSDLTNDSNYQNAVQVEATVENVTGLCKFTIPSFSSLPITVYNPKITADHEVVYFYLSNSSAQTSEWDATFADGSVTISGSISGSTTLLLKVAICEELTVTTS